MKNGIKVTYQPKPLRVQISEMIGRFVKNRGWSDRYSMTWALYNTDNSIDFAKCNYWLTRAIYYASEVKDPQSGKYYGKTFLLGAGFGKPIVNSAAAFTIGKMPEVVSEENPDQATDINKWLEDVKSDILFWVRNGFRDGDSYFRLNKDGSSSLVAPHKVEKIFDIVSGELLGYDITNWVKDEESNKMIKFVEELRKEAPFRRVLKYTQDSRTGVLLADSEDNDFSDEERPLPIIPFHNEQEPDQAYGNTEYQNIYVDMANYHAIMENAVKNNIYNSNAVPVLTGISDVEKFTRENGTQKSDGTYELKWAAQKLLAGGKDFDAKIVGGVQNASDSDMLLNLFFWKIAQGSETPEFVFGTAVQSSKASVSEQTPIAVMKGERKQTQLTEPLKNLIKTKLWYGSKFNKEKFNPELEFEIKWLPIMGDDMRLNLDIVKTLSDLGCITDKTKLILLNMGRYIQDFDAELEAAKGEREEKQKLLDPFAGSAVGNPKINPNQNKKKVVKEMSEDEFLDVLQEATDRTGRVGRWVTMDGRHVFIADSGGGGKGGGGGSGGGGGALISDSPTLEEINKLDDDLLFPKAGDEGKLGDRILARIYEKQGYHAKGKLLSKEEFDKQIAKGTHIEVHRGVSGKARVEDFKTGDEHYPGYGVLGNGTYASTYRPTAESYSRYNEQGLIHMALDRKAKIIDNNDLSNEMREGLRKIPQRNAFSEVFKEQKAKGLTNQQADELLKVRNKEILAENNKIRALYNDNGRYAAMRGYDAIVSDRGGTITGKVEKYYVILNRGKVIIEK